MPTSEDYVETPPSFKLKSPGLTAAQQRSTTFAGSPRLGLVAAARGAARTRAAGPCLRAGRHRSAAARRRCAGPGPATDEAGPTARAGKILKLAQKIQKKVFNGTTKCNIVLFEM